MVSATAQLKQEAMTRAQWQAGVMGSLNVVVAILAVRLILLVAVVGSIALTWEAVAAPDPWRLAALGIYAAVVCVPLVWLSAHR